MNKMKFIFHIIIIEVTNYFISGDPLSWCQNHYHSINKQWQIITKLINNGDMNDNFKKSCKLEGCSMSLHNLESISTLLHQINCISIILVIELLNKNYQNFFGKSINMRKGIYMAQKNNNEKTNIPTIWELTRTPCSV